MSTANVSRWSGVVSVMAGLWVLGISLSAGQPWIYAVGTLLAILALISIYAVQVEESGLWGLAGFVISIASEVLMMVEGDPQESLGMLAGALYALGLIALAVGTWRGRAFSRWVPGLWLAAIVVGLPAYAAESLMQPLIIAASMAFGLAFIVAGYELWTQRAPAKGRRGISDENAEMVV
jgi:hypothetical protein